MRVRRFAGKAGWSLAGQAASSVSNLGLSIAVAQVASESQFGAFAVAFAAYQFLLGTSRSAVGEPMLLTGVRGTNDPRLSAAASAGVVLGLLGLAAALILWWALPASYGQYLIFVALFAPALMCFDAMRFAFFSVLDQRRAFLLDSSWLVVQAGAFVLLFGTKFASVETLISGWAASALVVAMVALAMTRTVPSVGAFRRWVDDHREMSPRFWGEYLAISGSQQSIIVFAGVFGSLSGLASIRGAQVAWGPLNTLTAGLSSLILPTMSRLANHNVRRLLRLSLLVSAGLALSTAAFAVILAIIPASMGELLLGSAWDSTRSVLTVFAIMLAVGNLAYGATSGLRALGKIRESFRLRLFTTPIVVALIAFGASSQGAEGAIQGASIGIGLQACVWWVFYVVYWRRAVRGL